MTFIKADLNKCFGMKILKQCFGEFVKAFKKRNL